MTAYLAASAVSASRRARRTASQGAAPLPAGGRPAAVPLARQTGERDPDALYRDREHLDSARAAQAIWRARLAGTPAFEPAWKLARVCYWLGTQGPEDARRAELDAGVAAGEQAIALGPDRPEGHFWLAANMGALAESFGLRQGLKYRGRIRSELERVLAIDPAWQQGSADRALGRWYDKVPWLFGGSDGKAEEHLRRALTYNPQSTATLVFLAELLADDRGRRAEARGLLQRALDAPIDPEWAPEDRAFKRRAADLLREIGGVPGPPAGRPAAPEPSVERPAAPVAGPVQYL
ncbi:MAG: TRAP transporter TatT component family protein [Vicinamibacterales bacterium]